MIKYIQTNRLKKGVHFQLENVWIRMDFACVTCHPVVPLWTDLASVYFSFRSASNRKSLGFLLSGPLSACPVPSRVTLWFPRLKVVLDNRPLAPRKVEAAVIVPGTVLGSRRPVQPLMRSSKSLILPNNGTHLANSWCRGGHWDGLLPSEYSQCY